MKRTCDLPVPRPERLVELIKGIKKERTRALVSILYLTGARINEIAHSLCLQDVEHLSNYIHPRTGEKRDIWLIRLKNLKNRKTITKTIPLHMHIWIDKDLFPLFYEYAIKCKNPQIPIFKIGDRRCEKIIEDIGIPEICYPHILRHYRVTHWASSLCPYHYNPQQIQKMAGWSNLLPFAVYAHLIFEDLII